MIKVVIEVSSKADLPLSERIVEGLNKLGIRSVLRVASAHKDSPQWCEAGKEQVQESDEFTGNDIYSSLISIQQRVGQYLNMADEA